MAPTLMGQHKDLLCPECGYRFRVGASSENEDLAAQRGRPGQVQDVVKVTCPMCRYVVNVDPQTAQGRVSDLRRRSHSREQVRLRVFASATLGRAGLQVSGRSANQLHQAARRAARGDRQALARRRLYQTARRRIPDRVARPVETVRHGADRLRQRLRRAANGPARLASPLAATAP